MQIKYFVLILVITGVLACGGPDKNAGEKVLVADNSGISKNSNDFNQSFEKLLASYFSLKDGFVNYDTAKVNAASREIVQYSDSLRIEEIKNDSSGAIKETARNYTGTISGSAQNLIKETDIQKKKKEFQAISDGMYDLVRTVKYDGQKIYHQHCPMAFNEENEAYWLSNSNIIENPYLGKKHPKYRDAMLHCGDIPDSLDFSK